MEDQQGLRLDAREEVRKLQEMVRKLELQNEELRIGQKKNGIIHDSKKQQQPKQRSQEEDDNSTFDYLQIFDYDELLDDQIWLYRSSKYNVDSVSVDLEVWLERELNRGVPSVDVFKNNISRRLTEVKKSVEQRQVDTRTFTRPKKRLALSTPSYQPDIENIDICREINPSLTHLSASDEENTPVPNGPVLNVHNSQHVRERSLPRYSGAPKTSVLDGTFKVERSATPERQTPERLQSQSGRLTPDRKGNTGLPVPRSRIDKNFGFRTGSCSPLNRTFNLDGVPVRAGEGMEDDQMSSASDSSFSSSHRALTAGEVRNLARMQEESLKYSSTPHWKSNPEGRQPVHQMSSDLPSPITRSTEDFHSDHSSVEGGRSSRSSVVGDSLHSSPAGSPFGSSQALMTLARPPDGMLGSNEALDRPLQARNIPNKQRVEGGSRGLVRPMLVSGTRGHSAGVAGLKPQCLVRPSVVQNNLGMAPAPMATSGIPRAQGLRAPGSRIPAPRARSAASKAQDWMDGCY